jgi:hypothetical protein
MHHGLANGTSGSQPTLSYPALSESHEDFVACDRSVMSANARVRRWRGLRWLEILDNGHCSIERYAYPCNGVRNISNWAWTMRILLAGVLGFALLQPSDAGSFAAEDNSPTSVFATFLRALKADDLASAKKCWTISNNDKAGVLDALIGNCIAQRRFQR